MSRSSDGGPTGDLATGKMSLLFTGITLSCAQIGSVLVALPSLFQQTMIWPSVVILVLLGLVALAACFYLQQLWLYMRKAQLDAKATGVPGSHANVQDSESPSQSLLPSKEIPMIGNTFLCWSMSCRRRLGRYL